MTAHQERSLRWDDLAVRAASAGVLAPLGLAAIWSGGRIWEIVLAMIVAGLGAEWAGLCGIDARSPHGLGIPAALLTAGGATAFVSPAGGLVILAIGALLATFLARRGAAGVGVAYVGIAYLSLTLLRNQVAGLADVLLVVLVVWGSDIGAYALGRLVGGRRMAPRWSPGKTWSGAAGGLLCGTLAGIALARGFGATSGGLLAAAALSAMLSLVAQAGDLLESAIKRHFGKKDSGSIIPGHGGLLDRLDGLIAAAPAAYLLSMLTAPGKAFWEWGFQ